MVPAQAAAPSPAATPSLAAAPATPSRAEKRAARQALREWKAEARAAAPKGEQGVIGKIFLLIIAFILPPVAVLFKVGLGGHFWLNLLLTLLGFVPGVIHAILVITDVV